MHNRHITYKSEKGWDSMYRVTINLLGKTVTLRFIEYPEFDQFTFGESPNDMTFASIGTDAPEDPGFYVLANQVVSVLIERDGELATK